MSADIVERLRRAAVGMPQDDMNQTAADVIEARDAEIERLRAEVSRMACTCLPCAEPHDGMCSRCMTLRGPS